MGYLLQVMMDDTVFKTLFSCGCHCSQYIILLRCAITLNGGKHALSRRPQTVHTFSTYIAGLSVALKQWEARLSLLQISWDIEL